jgi:hypothetical protein
MRAPKKYRHSVTSLWALDLRVTILFGTGKTASYLIVMTGFKCDDSVMPSLAMRRNHAEWAVPSKWKEAYHGWVLGRVAENEQRGPEKMHPTIAAAP